MTDGFCPLINAMFFVFVEIWLQEVYYGLSFSILINIYSFILLICLLFYTNIKPHETVKSNKAKS